MHSTKFKYTLIFDLFSDRRKTRFIFFIYFLNTKNFIISVKYYVKSLILLFEIILK